MSDPFVSIIITNYNYARFLPLAIESALAQHYPHTEVIVVDDGSTDGSHAILSRYAPRVHVIRQANAGQTAAFSAGLRESRGELILFLDADDALLPHAAARAADAFRRTRPVKIHWPLWVMDGQGETLQRRWPACPLPQGDLRDVLRRCGPSSLRSPPTSGNAWDRRFLERVLPSAGAHALCADDYLYALAPAFGTIACIDEPLGMYRLHGENNYLNKPFEEKVALGMRLHDEQCHVLQDVFAAGGDRIDPDSWRRHSWYHRLQRALDSLGEVIPRGARIVLVDEDQWGAPERFAGFQRYPFMERGGRYFGPPPDAETAIHELHRLWDAGARFVVFAWSCFWWLEHYAAFGRYLRVQHSLALANDCVTVFELRG